MADQSGSGSGCAVPVSHKRAAPEDEEELDEPITKRPIKPMPMRGKGKGKDKEPLLTMAGYGQTPAELAATFPTKESLAATTNRDGAWLLDTTTALQTQTNRYTKRLDALGEEKERLEALNSTIEQEKQSLSNEVHRLNKVVFELHYKVKRLNAQSATTSTPNPFAFQPATVHANAWPSFTSQILQTESSQEIALLRQQLTGKQAEIDDLQRQLNEARDTLATERQSWDQEKTAANTQYQNLSQSEVSLGVQNSQLQSQVSALYAQCQANESLTQQLQQARLDFENLSRQENVATTQATNAQGRIQDLTREVEALRAQASCNTHTQDSISATEGHLEVYDAQAQLADMEIEFQNTKEEQLKSIAKLMKIFADSKKLEPSDGDVPATFEDVAGKINEALQWIESIESSNRELNKSYRSTWERIEQELVETGLKSEFLSLDNPSAESAISLLGTKLRSAAEEKANLQRDFDNLSSSTSSQSSEIANLIKLKNEMAEKLEAEAKTNADLLELQRNTRSNDLKTIAQALEKVLVSNGTQTNSYDVELNINSKENLEKTIVQAPEKVLVSNGTQTNNYEVDLNVNSKAKLEINGNVAKLKSKILRKGKTIADEVELNVNSKEKLEINGNVAELNSEILKKDKTIADNTEQINSLHRANMKLSEDFLDAKIERRELLNEIKVLNAKIDESDLLETIDQQFTKISGLKTDLRAAEEKIDEMAKELEDLEDVVLTHESTIETLNTTHDAEIKKDTADYVKLLRKHNQTVQQLKDDHKQEIEALKEDLQNGYRIAIEAIDKENERVQAWQKEMIGNLDTTIEGLTGEHFKEVDRLEARSKARYEDTINALQECLESAMNKGSPATNDSIDEKATDIILVPVSYSLNGCMEYFPLTIQVQDLEKYCIGSQEVSEPDMALFRTSTSKFSRYITNALNPSRKMSFFVAFVLLTVGSYNLRAPASMLHQNEGILQGFPNSSCTWKDFNPFELLPRSNFSDAPPQSPEPITLSKSTESLATFSAGIPQPEVVYAKTGVRDLVELRKLRASDPLSVYVAFNMGFGCFSRWLPRFGIHIWKGVGKWFR